MEIWHGLSIWKKDPEGNWKVALFYSYPQKISALALRQDEKCELRRTF